MKHVHVLVASKLFWISFICIILLAVAISGYKLGSVPHGLTWDEAAIGYNGYAIFTTRRDEWLTKLPISFRSFGDYKAPLAIYSNGIFTAVFGLNPFGIRLPFMIASVLSAAGLMLLIQLLWEGKKHVGWYSICAGLLFITSPWYVHYSRTGFESGLALFFTIWAVYFFLLFRRFQSSLPIVLSVLFFALSLYTYHSSKIVVPLLVLFLLYFSKHIFNRKVIIKLIGSGLGGLALCYFLIQDAVMGQGLERAGVTLFSQYGFGEAVWLSIKQFGLHLLPSFLINGATTTLRHGDGRWGVLLLPTFLLTLINMAILLPKWRSGFNKNNILLGLAWLLIGILPAAIATEVPHSNRALLALPGFIILAVGAIDWITEHFDSHLIMRLSIGTILLLQGFFFISYIKDYFTVFAAQSATDFKDGYVEAFQLAYQYELGSDQTPQVGKIIFASDYGQPYIYALLVRETNPIEYQHGSLLRYEFRDDISNKDVEQTNVLVIAIPGDITTVKPTYTIYGSDGEAKFEVFTTPSY